jgi:uncharacterized membrane protein
MIEFYILIVIFSMFGRIKTKMIKEPQQLIIILLGAIAIIALLKDYDMIILSTIIGILGGFLTGKTLTEKQQEIIEETITAGDGDVR